MIQERFRKVILDVLELEAIKLSDDNRASDVPGWDSLRHINIILALEDEYGIRLQNKEIVKCKNIGDLQDLVSAKSNT